MSSTARLHSASAGSVDLSVELQLVEGRAPNADWCTLSGRCRPSPSPIAQTGGMDARGFAVRKLDPDEIASLRKVGVELFANRNVACARLTLHAAEAADARAALALAKTDDPIALRDFGLRGAFAYPAMARTWYDKGNSVRPRRSVASTR